MMTLDELIAFNQQEVKHSPEFRTRVIEMLLPLTAIPDDLRKSIYFGEFKYDLQFGRCNRRYGGKNDLHSLGQILYRMVAGKHFFNPTVDKPTFTIPDEIKAERERTYADPQKLEKRLQQVKKNITDVQLAGIIRTCLTAQGTDEDYRELEKRFSNAA